MRALAVCAALAGAAFAQDEGLKQNSYQGKAPPELGIAKDNWINVKDAVTLAKLNGRVVWIEFGFLG